MLKKNIELTLYFNGINDWANYLCNFIPYPLPPPHFFKNFNNIFLSVMESVDILLYFEAVVIGGESW